jgi:prepilin-type N-terminal cleavage/methylation domain-containing protein
MNVIKSEPCKGKTRLKKSSGFTLLEVLIAMTILSIVLLGIATLQVTAIHTNFSNNTLTVAAGLADGVIESLVSMDGDDPFFQAELPADPGDPWPVWDPLVTVDGGGDYTITYRCDVDADGVSNVTRIDVRVESVTLYPTPSGPKKRVATATTLKRYF